MRIIPTSAQQELIHFTPSGPANYVDVSLESPEQQFQVLDTLLAQDDLDSPAPYTATPPWGEPIDEAEYIPESIQQESYMPTADVEAAANIELHSVINDPAPLDQPEWIWENDDQYYGLAVPPGVPNYGQAIESGHTQIVRNNPSAELGWDAWSGRPVLARVARHENQFRGYNAGTNRKLGQQAVMKLFMPYYLRTQQSRDLLLVELKRRGVHNVVIADIPAVPYTEQVAVVDPSVLAPQPEIGPEGWLP